MKMALAVLNPNSSETQYPPSHGTITPTRAMIAYFNRKISLISNSSPITKSRMTAPRWAMLATKSV
jgi:hypothetical protein